MSYLKIEIKRPVTSENASSVSGKILRISGEFSEATLFEAIVIWVLNLFDKDSPYHGIGMACRVESVAMQFRLESPALKQNVLANLTLLESDFIVHSSSKSQPAVKAAFNRAKAALNPSSVEMRSVGSPSKPAITFEDLVETYMTATKHVQADISRLSRQYSGQTLSKNDIKLLSVSLSKLGLKQLVGQYGESVVKSVVGNFSEIESGRALLDLKKNASYAGDSLHFKLGNTSEQVRRTTAASNKAFLDRLKTAHGSDRVEQMAGAFLTAEEMGDTKTINNQRRLELEALCRRSEVMERAEALAAEFRDQNFLHSGLFSPSFIEGQEEKSVTEVQAAVIEGLAGQSTSSCVKWVREVFGKVAGDQIIYFAFKEMRAEITLDEAEKISADNIDQTLRIAAGFEETFNKGTFSESINAGDAFEAAVMQAFQRKL
jgi:hypothetical protein